MPTVSNRFFVTAIKDGAVANGYLRCNASLQQFYDKETKTCAPDWRVGKQAQGEVQPVITAYTRLGGNITSPSSNKWYWNGVEIQFNGNNSLYTYTMEVDGSTVTYPLFVKGVDANGLPTLRINGNLAGYGATGSQEPVIDQDIITNTGKITIDGSELDYSLDIVVRLSYLVVTNGYWGNISFNGNSVITSDDVTTPEGKVQLVPALYLGTQPQSASNYTVHWYIEPSTDKGTGSSLTLTANDVTDNVTVRCDFYSVETTPKFLCSAYIEVDDAQDDDEMQITHPGGQSSANLRRNQSVTFTIWMSSRQNPTQVKSVNLYNNFKVKILNSSSHVITDQIAPQGATITDGFWKITKNNIKVIDDPETIAARAGQVTIPFAVVAAEPTYDGQGQLVKEGNGDGISGVVVAYYETESQS